MGRCCCRVARCSGVAIASSRDDSNRQAALRREPPRCEAASMTSTAAGPASDEQPGVEPMGHGATVLRPRRLVGRDWEIVEVNERIALTPLTTVTGPAGVGKTALALTVAAASQAQFPDGVFVVWLASLRSVEHVAGEVAAQVGLPRSGAQTYEDFSAHWLADPDVL